MLKKTALALSLALGGTAIVAAVPASAQSRGTTASVDLEKVLEGSSAARAALAQIQATYAANIQQAQQVEANANAQLQPLVASGQAEQAKPQPNQSQLQTLSAQISQVRAQTQAQVQQLIQPAQIAQAYVSDQINRAVVPAVAAVATARRAGVVVSRDSALYVDPASDLTNDVIAELNRTTPQVSIVAPPEWLQARGVGAPGTTAPAPAPTPQPQGR